MQQVHQSAGVKVQFLPVGRERRESVRLDAVNSAKFVAPFGESEAAVLYVRRLD